MQRPFIITACRGILRAGLIAPFLLTPSALAQQAPSDDSGAPVLAFDGPSAPEPPATVSRDAQGRVTMRAVRIATPIVLDGRLDEAAYTESLPTSDFVQQEPLEGQPATEKSEVWIFFDDRNIYVSGRLWDSQPHRITANEMRRDNRNIFLNDNFGFAIDTFHNKRTGFFFQINPLAGLRDALVADEGQTNYDWDGVWDARTARFDQGWTIEISVPFKTLRFEGSEPQLWGINFRRMVRWKNETSVLSPVPASYGNSGVARFSRAATLVGIDPPSGYRNLEFKPYGISEVVTNKEVTPVVSADVDAEAGIDMKYGLTRSLIADFTVNTDFAQVETDEQQVNLTRFSLFFPEKREFFLEGQGIFEFAGLRQDGGGNVSNGPILFFSRRIGLERGVTVPILAGGRVTGRAGPYAVGALNIQTREVDNLSIAPTNFSVVRLRRDILRRSSVGFLATRRVTTSGEAHSNDVYGVDANFAFFQDVQANAYYARSSTPGAGDDEDSYYGSFRYNADRYGVDVYHLKVGTDFNPEVGFMRREDFRESAASLRFSPRPQSIKSVRKFSWEGSFSYITNLAGLLETREAGALFETQFQSADIARIEYTDAYEFLPEPFEIHDGVTLGVGGYDFGEAVASLELGPQRRITGSFEAGGGEFYGGDRRLVGYNGRIEVSPRLSVEPRIQVNWVDLPEGSFTTRLFSGRTTFTVSPRMFAGALIQYNSSTHSFSSNVRFRWEYQPGSDLFVVYSEGRDMFGDVPRGLLNRGFVVKVTRLFRM
jgi:hypothetical protein